MTMRMSMLLGRGNLICCNFPILQIQNFRTSLQPHTFQRPLSQHTTTCFVKPLDVKTKTKTSLGLVLGSLREKGCLHICHSLKKESEVGGNGNGRDWTSSILLFLLWAALMYYVFFLSPNQTPSTDIYFLRKLLNLAGDDGFKMNEVLVSLWYLMGLWPLAYSMLLIPTGRSSKNNIPVWPFLLLSFFGGAYALLPYFVLWKPPAPPVEETQLKMWPLNFLESKVTAMVSLAAGAAIITYAGLAGQEVWKEFYLYFRSSKFVSSDSAFPEVGITFHCIHYISFSNVRESFNLSMLIFANVKSIIASLMVTLGQICGLTRIQIHIMSIDFSILSTFAPFWVYNDMTARKWFDKGSWLLPISLIPFMGPSLYILLRPSLSTVAISQTPVEPE